MQSLNSLCSDCRATSLIMLNETACVCPQTLFQLFLLLSTIAPKHSIADTTLFLRKSAWRVEGTATHKNIGSYKLNGVGSRRPTLSTCIFIIQTKTTASYCMHGVSHRTVINHSTQRQDPLESFCTRLWSELRSFKNTNPNGDFHVVG